MMNEDEMTEAEVPQTDTSCEGADMTEQENETDSLRGEVERLRGELEAALERERAQSRMMAECSDFGKYFPKVELGSIPDEVWECVKDGIPLSYSYALYERKLALAREAADEINSRNRSMSSGAVASASEEHYFSPSEVKKMTPSDVKKNYSEIIESMKHWH